MCEKSMSLPCFLLNFTDFLTGFMKFFDGLPENVTENIGQYLYPYILSE